MIVDLQGGESSRRKAFRSLRVFGTVAIAAVLAGTAHASQPEAAGESSANPSASISPDEEPNSSCSVTLRLYDPVELTYLEMSPPGSRCSSTIPGLVMTSYTGYLQVTGFPEGFRGPADLMTCHREDHHSECTPLLEDLSVLLLAYAGPEGGLPEPPAICPSRFDCDIWQCEPQETRVADRCGDADGNGNLRALDALTVLRAAVGLQECPPQRCDVDRDGESTATDARSVLSASVGIEVSLVCPAPCEAWAPGS